MRYGIQPLYRVLGSASLDACSASYMFCHGVLSIGVASSLVFWLSGDRPKSGGTLPMPPRDPEVRQLERWILDNTNTEPANDYELGYQQALLDIRLEMLRLAENPPQP